MPSVFTLEGGAPMVQYPIYTVPTAPPPPKTYSPRAFSPRMTRAMAGLAAGITPAKLVAALVGGGVLVALVWQLSQRRRRPLRGSSMVQTIARESRSADEYARRVEAWNAGEARPQPITKLARAYRKASPSKVARLIREAQENRMEGRERLWSRMSRGLRGLGGYRVAYGTSGGGKTYRVYDERTLDNLEHAKKLMRSYKRQGFWTWIEDDQGNFVPVPGAMRESVRKSYPVR